MATRGRVCTCWRLNPDGTHKRGCDLAPPATNTDPVQAAVRIGSSEWAVTWHPGQTHEYMIAQLAFEARRAAERELK
jgi:hypothetical protein